MELILKHRGEVVAAKFNKIGRLVDVKSDKVYGVLNEDVEFVGVEDIDVAPKLNSKTAVLKKFLDKRQVPYGMKASRKELMELVKKNR